MSSVESLLTAPAHRGPPKDIKPNELVLKLQDTRRPSEVLPFPRKNEDGQPVFSYRMMILTPEELDIARANADRYTRGKLADTLEITDEQAGKVRTETWVDIYNDALKVEALYESMRRDDDCTKKLWDAPSQLRRLLTTDEVTVLFRAYQEVQFRLGPMWRILNAEEVGKWIDRLTDGTGAYPLESLGPGEQSQLLYSMAFLLLPLRTATGSFGSPTAADTTETIASETAK